MKTKKKKVQIPLQVMELEEENYHILIESVMGNGKTCKWVIDTGASKTVFDINLKTHYTELPDSTSEIQSAGIGEIQIDTKAGMLNNIRFADYLLEKLPVALIDLSHINKLYYRYTKERIAGLVGSDFLWQHNALIDFRKKILTLTVSNS